MINLFKSVRLSPNISPASLGLQHGITAGFLVLATANVGMYILTSKTIEQLREELNQIKQIEKEL